jgi:ribosome biogenesis GTPase A
MKKEIPGHIKKAFRSIDKFLPVVDLVVELVDARMPEGSRVAGLTERLGKKTIIAMGKSDLANPEETTKWIKKYKSQGLSCVALDSRSRAPVKKLRNLLQKVAFTSKKGEKAPARKVRRVMIIGIPNVGKSTLINSLAGRKAAKAANMPGVTRSIQWIKLAGKLELLDLPGILDFSLIRRGNVLRLINTIPGRDDDSYEQARLLCEVLLRTDCADLIPGLAGSENKFDKFISEYAVKMNFIQKGGIPDSHRASADVIKRFQAGTFGKVTIEKADKINNLFLEDQETASDEDLNNL